MREADIDTLRRVELEILDVVAKFCDEHEIAYWLDGGTLIGAIRHKGYIPWDDDIDLGMLRPDYDKFMRLFNQTSTRYRFHSIENDPEFETPFGKVLDTETVLYEPDETGFKLAIYIDIFVYDNAPDDEQEIKAMFDARDTWWKRYYEKFGRRVFRYARGNILRRLCAYSFRMIKNAMNPVCYFSRPYYTRKILENSKTCSSRETKRAGNFLGWSRLVFDKSLVSELIEGEFEGRKFKIPAGYDEYLRLFYGDYMKLPPPEERVTHHAFKAFVK